MINEKKAANAIGGKTARACDGCLRKRARWYCVADDAFLCQVCDASVHSANQLASRHERVRLEAASSCSKLINEYNIDTAAPVWHHGFTRKARTPRPNSNKAMSMVQTQAKDDYQEKVLNLNSNESLVPEIGSAEVSLDEVTEEQLLCQVPVFEIGSAAELGCETTVVNGEENLIGDGNYGQDGTCDFDDLHGFLPSDMDLAEFAADVESLLGGGLDEDSGDFKELGLLDCKEEKIELKVKDEEVEGVAAIATSHFVPDFSTATREAIDWKFDYDDQSKAVPQVPEMKRNISLKLNFDAVITAWASQGCPWTTGSRPEFNPNDCWPDCKGSCCKDAHRYSYGEVFGGHMGGCGDGEREARVSRYREKRRTRLFSKKIRYEVRKLNAEKRPRMKGRFVKRTSFNAFPYLNNH